MASSRRWWPDCQNLQNSHNCEVSWSPKTVRPVVEQAHHPDPVPQRGRDAAGHAGGTPEIHPRHRHHRSPRRRRRVAGWYGGCRARRRRRSRRSAAAQQRARRCLRRRHRRIAQARRRLHRQYRRRQPVSGRPDPGAARAAAERRSGHRHRRSKHCRGPAHVVAKAPAAAAGELGGAPGLEHVGPRHDERVPRVYPRRGAAHDHRVGVLLHARVDHPGGQEADGDRPRADRDQPAHAEVPALRQRVLLHQAIGRDHRPHLRDVRAAEDLYLRRRGRDLRWRPDLVAIRLHVSHRTGVLGSASAVVAVCRRLPHRRRAGAADRSAGRRHLGQPQTAGRSPVSRPLARAPPDDDDADDADAGVSSPRELSRTGVGRRWDR